MEKIFKKGLILSYRSGNLAVSSMEKGFYRWFDKCFKVDWMDYVGSNGIKSFETYILDFVDKEKIEVILFLQPSGIAVLPLELLKKLSQKSILITTAWDLETFFEFIDRYYAQFADAFIVVSGKYFMDLLKGYGIRAYLTGTLFDSEHYMKFISEYKDVDVSFVGNIRKGRRYEYINFLRENGVNVEVYGRGTDKGEISNDEMFALFGKSKIVLNFSENTVLEKIPFRSNFSTLLNQFKGRITEAMLCGAFVLSEYAEGEFRYTQGEHYDTFKTKEELLEKVKFYLKNDDIREKIALKGLEKSREDFDSTKALGRILKDLAGLPDSESRKYVMDDVLLKVLFTSHFIMMIFFCISLKFKSALDEFIFLVKNIKGININKFTLVCIGNICLKHFLKRSIIKRVIFAGLGARLRKYKKVVIWGGGKHTENLFKELSFFLRDLDIVGIYDINPDLDGKSIEGFKVTSDKSILKKAEAVIVSSFFYRKEIKDMAQSFWGSDRIIDIYETRWEFLKNFRKHALEDLNPLYEYIRILNS